MKLPCDQVLYSKYNANFMMTFHGSSFYNPALQLRASDVGGEADCQAVNVVFGNGIFLGVVIVADHLGGQKMN